MGPRQIDGRCLMSYIISRIAFAAPIWQFMSLLYYDSGSWVLNPIIQNLTMAGGMAIVPLTALGAMAGIGCV